MSPMVLPVARTRDEAHLYLDLHPCERCGGVDVAWDSAPVVDGTPARRYAGVCGECGASREFVFAEPERSLEPGPDVAVLFGGSEPSRLLDPGEWMLVADLCAQAAAVPEGAEPDAEARYSLAVAVAAVEEIIKFLPPGGDAVPEPAFSSARGRTVYHQERGRFHRRRLYLVRNSYRDSLTEMGGVG